jgi:hypothetical protein
MNVCRYSLRSCNGATNIEIHIGVLMANSVAILNINCGILFLFMRVSRIAHNGRH